MKTYNITFEQWTPDDYDIGQESYCNTVKYSSLRDTVVDLMECDHPFEWPTVQTTEHGILVTMPEDADGVREYRTLHLPDISANSMRRIARLLGVRA